VTEKGLISFAPQPFTGHMVRDAGGDEGRSDIFPEAIRAAEFVVFPAQAWSGRVAGGATRGPLCQHGAGTDSTAFSYAIVTGDSRLTIEFRCSYS
jgi:hypothetical protein